jgi:hypothetical protein
MSCWVGCCVGRELVERALQVLEHDVLRSVVETLRDGCYEIEQLGTVYEEQIGAHERRRTASHYTPRSLTAPIVERTLAPLFAGLGDSPGSEQLLSLKICDPAMGAGAFLLEVCRQLAERVVAAWAREGELAQLHEDPQLLARRLVAKRCLFGVDKNPIAVELAKLSLWLLCEAEHEPLSFVDHALRCGDSLIGLSLAQIRGFHWKRADPTLDEAMPLPQLRIVADVLLGGFFSADGDKQREHERMRRLGLVRAWSPEPERSGGLNPNGPQGAREAGRTRSDRVQIELLTLQRELREHTPAFHWALEFPRMDAFVGNPPFLGGKRISTLLGSRYLDFLALAYSGSQNADLCAYFFVQCQRLLGGQGTLGLVATNTIHQGDTRRTGLRAVVEQGGTIYEARRACPWPGTAAVTVSIVHIAFGRVAASLAPRRLDDREVANIDSHLTANPERPTPLPLLGNRGCCYMGAYILGAGFFVSDEEHAALLAEQPESAEVLKPALRGQELNSDPRQQPSRTIIDLGGLSLEQARARWPGALALLERRVKPERALAPRAGYREVWWQFGERQASLYDVALPAIEHCHVRSSVSKHHAVARVSARFVFPHTVVVFAVASNSFFAVIQARVHEVWARLFSSSLEDRPRYTPSTCFETFPFPEPDPRAIIPALEDIGRRLEQARARIMSDRELGLTKLYNALKDPGCQDPQLLELRDLHTQLDRAVLDAYGWSDLEVPPYAAPHTEAFEAAVLDRLFALNVERSTR